jgi:hypothetical protein
LAGRARVFASFGSSGWCSRISPSRAALRRTRSAWASSMLDEWLLTPIPSARERSSASLFVRPSSRASSYNRIFLGNCYINPFCWWSKERPRDPSILARSRTCSRSTATCDASTGARKARPKACRRAARSRHGTAGRAASAPTHPHAPRPGAARSRASEPSDDTTTRTSRVAGATRRHPIQVRMGSPTMPPPQAC